MSVPSQMYLQSRCSSVGANVSAYVARTAELSPSAATTRSWVPASSRTSGASVRKWIVTPSWRQRAWRISSRRRARHRRERVPAAGDDLALEVHVDVVPDRELRLHLREDLRIGVLDAAEGLVAEDHPEAEGVVGGVALPHGDLVRLPGDGRELLRERAEVEAARPATDHRDPHARQHRAFLTEVVKAQ